METEHRSATSARAYAKPYHKMECPHCQHALSLAEAILILNGSGTEQMAMVRAKDGAIAFLPAGLVNPLELEVIGGNGMPASNPSIPLESGIVAYTQNPS